MHQLTPITYQDTVFHCRSCKQECTLPLPINCEVSLFTKGCRKLACPSCGAGWKLLDLVRTPA